MLLIVFAILLYQAFTGIVEGIKNLQVPETKFTTQNAYHWWRIGQGAAVLCCIAAGAFTGLHWLIILVAGFAWAGGDGLYNRILNLIAWNDINHDWQPTERPWWVKVFHPSVQSDWYRFASCTIVAIIRATF